VPLKFIINEEKDIVIFGHQINKEKESKALVTMHAYNPLRNLPMLHVFELNPNLNEVWNLRFFD
jgi:hypothetical protein